MSVLVPRRYIPKSLSSKDKKKQTRELRRSREGYKKGQYYTRKKVASFKSKGSPHVARARRIYGIENVRPGPELSRKTGCSVSALRKIVRKGEGAYFSSGSRPNQTAHSWGYARLASAITSGKSSVIDYPILAKGCKKGSKALRLAKKAMQVSRRSPPKVSL